MNTKCHPENKNMTGRGYYTTNGFVRSQPQRVYVGWHPAPELVIGLPLLTAILYLVAKMVGWL